MFVSNYPLLDVFISSVFLALLLWWIVLAFHVIADVFRSPNLSGGAKAAWITLTLVLPALGALIYVVARGGSSHERATPVADASYRNFEEYVRRIANSKE